MAIDKAQKQLNDTYFRKRMIAVGDGRRDYEEYELVYLANNGMLDFSKLSAENIVWALKYYPKRINDVNLKKLAKNTPKIIRILFHRPEFYDKLNAELDLSKMFDSKEISTILSNVPELIDKMNLEKLQGYSLVDLIVYNPNLVPKLAEKGNLDYLTMRNVNDILWEHPNLRPYFEEHIKSHEAMVDKY